MINIGGIDHLVLRTANLDGMLTFYRDVLGVTVERQIDSLGLYQLRAGASLIDLVDVAGKLGQMGGAAPGREALNLDHFCLTVADFDAALVLAHLDRNGVEHGEVEQRYGAQGTGPSIYLKDADGNTVELKGPPADV